jgi:hypothetical protein
MIHDSTWLREVRAMRRRRLTAVTGFLLACLLLAGLPAGASAAAPEMRGEWEVVMKSGAQTLAGIATIAAEANAQGEFSGSVLYGGVDGGSISGTLEGAKATVEVTSDPFGPYAEGIFNSSTIAVVESGESVSMSGEGILVSGGKEMQTTLVVTRLRSQKQIEEQQAREKKEQEERAARARVRGEWSLTLEAGPEIFKGTALISAEANTKNEFSSVSALFESAIPSTFSGTLEGSEATVTIVTQAAGPYPEGKFTGTKLALASSASSMSITGTGTLSLGASSAPATLTATRTKTYQEVIAREKQEREAKEASEKAEKEALEAKAKAEREATEKTAREAKEKQERESREAAEKAVQVKIVPPPTPAALVSVGLIGKSFTASASGQVPLQIENPNGYAISGRVTLSVTASKGAKSKGAKITSLGTASFGLSSGAKQVVKLKLSRKGRSELARRKTLRVLATITTEASGQTNSTKTFSLTLSAGSAHRKG